MKMLLISLLSALICLSPALAADLDGHTFLRTSGPEARAVVKTPDGEIRLVKVGDVVGTSKVVEIARDRVVLEQGDEQAAAVLIVTLRDGRQEVGRVQPLLPKQAVISGAPEATGKPFGN